MTLGEAEMTDALESLWLIAVALVSIAVALWLLYFTLDDLAIRVRLVGVALRKWTPLDPLDAADRAAPVPPAKAAKSDASAPEAGSAPAKETR